MIILIWAVRKWTSSLHLQLIKSTLSEYTQQANRMDVHSLFIKCEPRSANPPLQVSYYTMIFDIATKAKQVSESKFFLSSVPTAWCWESPPFLWASSCSWGNETVLSCLLYNKNINVCWKNYQCLSLTLWNIVPWSIQWAS